ncbi:hypothetical protein [Flavobacterium sp.]|uniref:hypothetical protein n=1 Tax=Flavobacterium sp. TaxID=239 RepID=UPI002638BF17|nr:hypothetical protein [Flavobacterium sp.]
MKLKFAILFLIASNFLFGQKNQEHITRTYNFQLNTTGIPFSNYKELKNSRDIKIDSVGSIIIKSDTLIYVTGLPKMNGVKVNYEPKDSIFLETYKNLVYDKVNLNKTKKNKNLPTMKIWKEEIKVYFDSTVTNKNKRELVKLMKFIDKEIDSLKIKIVNSKEKSNYFIYFLNKPSDIDWDTRIKDKDGCYISWNDKQQIYKCTMKIDTKIIFNEKEQLMLMKKHFIWSLGYFSFLKDRDCKSFLSNCVSLDKELTNEDLELLKYHYSYGICKGTDLETFEQNHRSAKKSLEKNPNGEYYFMHN